MSDSRDGTRGDVVVAVCTSRLDQVEARWQQNIAHLDDGTFFVLLDTPEDARARRLIDQVRARGGQVICHGQTRGLSAARNSVLAAWPKHKVLFIDDDVLLDRAAWRAITEAFAGGAQVVGARLVPPLGLRRWPWFFTLGQMHLVGWHSAQGEIKTWGACMGIDAGFAREHGLEFDPRLGRTGRQLESGDDTTFVAAMRAAGAAEVLLPGVPVTHDVDPARLTVRYLARRAYWQGRSEIRRRQPIRGLSKEWRRHWSGGHRLILTPGYLSAFMVGMLHEVIAAGVRRA